jgi:hypothetical protein
MITTEFDKFSFHDSSVEKVDRSPGIISIEFENAFMSKDHPEANATDWLIDSGVLHLCNVTSEVPLFWYDNIEGKPHPEPQLPIDEIMNLEFNGKQFEFGGFLKSEPWVQWLVNATEFKIEIKGKHVAHS